MLFTIQNVPIKSDEQLEQTLQEFDLQYKMFLLNNKLIIKLVLEN